MVTSDYKTLKFGLEVLAIDNKIPIEHHEVLKNCETNEEGDVLMDVSNYNSESIEAIKAEIDLDIREKDENTLLIKGNFYSGPDVAPY